MMFVVAAHVVAAGRGRARLGGVIRTIVGLHADELGDWVAELSCGHNQHVRHQPPFQDRPWVQTASGRASRISAEIECRLCDHEETGDDAPASSS